MKRAHTFFMILVAMIALPLQAQWRTVLTDGSGLKVRAAEQPHNGWKSVFDKSAPQYAQAVEEGRRDDVRRPATDVRDKPVDHNPDQFADRRPTIAIQVKTEGWSNWFQGMDRQQFVQYANEMFAPRYQAIQAYNAPELRENMGEVEFANSEWTANASNTKTIGNMQNADYIAIIQIASSDPRNEYANVGVPKWGSRVQRWSLDTFVTIQIVAVNNRAILETGNGKGHGSITATLESWFNGRTVHGNGGIQQAAMYKAAREAAVEGMVSAFKNMKNM